MRAESVSVAADSTSLTLLLEPGEVSALWGEPRFGVMRDTTLSTSAIGRMSTRSRFRGALDGALVGLGAGVALSVLLSAASDDDWYAHEEMTALGGLVLGIVGGGIGAALGVVIGSSEIYVFVHR
jgi:hypothetical protein